MNRSRAAKITGLVVLFTLLPAVLQGAAQQLPVTAEAPAAIPAQGTTAAPAAAPVPPQQASVPSEGQALHILVGKSVVVNVQTPITRVLSSNPAVIETLATSPTEVVVEGRAAGTSSLILWDQSGRSQMLDVIVDLDVTGLRTAIEHAYPNQQVQVQADGGRLVLTGNVPDSKAAEDLNKMATVYSTQVVSSLQVAALHERQILLEVKFAEVDRTKLQQFGINLFSLGGGNTIGSVGTQQFAAPTVGGAGIKGVIGAPVTGTSSALQFSDLLNIFLFRPDINLGATIKDLEQKSVLEILAEPNLMAVNGQKATFLAGGEFPFPIVQPSQGFTTVTIQFKPFGVRLDFTGTISNDNIIRLHVAPEVSTLDFSNGLTISGFNIPAISTRRAETEVELKDGQSFGVAGLMDHRAQAQLSKVPGIGDIPVLGQLFRSRSINRSNTELMVLVTPHIVDPVHVPTASPVDPKLAIPYIENPKFDDHLPGAEKKPDVQAAPSAK
ncbi:MAG: type II and III secretion system protein family protein [Terriglobales bacterium]